MSEIIDCDASPFVFGKWEVVEHQKGGLFNWDASQVVLHLDEDQKNGKVIRGHKLREKLYKEFTQGRLLNANVLHFLYANQHLIPEEWKGKVVFFWGTVFRNGGDTLFVRCLDWHRGSWRWSSPWLDTCWGDDYFTAVRAR